WADEVFGGSIPPRLAVRVDASRLPGLSFGHAARCLLMARVLRERGCAVIFLMQDYADGVRYVRDHGFPVIPVADRSGFGDTLRAVERSEAGWLLVDLPYDDLDTRALEKAAHGGTKVVLLDDSRLLFPAVEVVLNSSVRTVGLRGGALQGPKRVFLGPQYFLLEAKRSLTGPTARECRRLLLTFGGSDPTGLTEAVLRALIGVPLENVSVSVVLGPGYGDPTPVESLAAALNRSTVLRAPENFLKVMADHDLIVCAGGRTMYEAWVHGIPFLPIGSAPHEAREVREFLERGLICFGLEEMDDIVFSKMLERFLH
ncbi:MAG TPA: hypothetical protein VKA04_12615, partial [Pseudodesulfovibrio sp.]|nr:hypothetical protein [Pseudodesulfovibrio sp.]